MVPRLRRIRFPVKACGYWVRARPWDELVERFRNALAVGGPYFSPHLRFCERMACPPYRDRFHAITSMHTFIISNTQAFDSGCEVLRLDFIDGTALFEYVEQPGVRTRWMRRAPADEAFDAVVRLAHIKRWFVEYGMESGRLDTLR